MKHLFKPSLLLLLLPLMAACTTAKPQITLEAPEEGAQCAIGNDIHFVAMLSDSRGLKTYSIQIAPKEGGTVSSGTVPFHYHQTWELFNEKETHLHHHQIIIPPNAAPGTHLFTIVCTNKSGKKSTTAVPIEVVLP